MKWLNFALKFEKTLIIMLIPFWGRPTSSSSAIKKYLQFGEGKIQQFA
jgi:hypothetical protein